MAKHTVKSKKGFTLIELLVVIAIIATLAVVVFVALDPVRRFQEARNATRRTDVNSILTAISQSIVDNRGALPAGLTADGNVYQIGTCSSGGAVPCTGAQAACADIAAGMTTYLKSMPVDPGGAGFTGSQATTGYSVSVDSNNLITVAACNAERGETIEVSR